MCPIPRTLSLQSKAAGKDTPDLPRDIFMPEPLHQHAVQHLVSRAVNKADPPTTNNSGFTCSIFTMHNKDFKPDNVEHDEVMEFPGDLVQDETHVVAPEQDMAREKCFKALKTSWDFFNSCFHRNSLDGNGLELRASIHLKKSLGGGFWDPYKKQMFLGDGGRYTEEGVPESATKFTSHLSPYTLDVVGHELTHGIISMTSYLGTQGGVKLPPDLNALTPEQKVELSRLPQAQREYFANRPALEVAMFLAHDTKKESQTLNEHIADCFGIMIKHFSAGHTAEQGNWDIGSGWWSAATMQKQNWTSNYLRTFKIPASGIAQPDDGAKVWSDRVKFYGWVDDHEYSGIGNHAFYQAALKFGGRTWEHVGKIWYDAMMDDSFKDLENQTYKGWRNLTIAHARALFKEDGAKKMTEAWRAVNM